MRYILIGLLCIVTLQGCAKSTGGPAGSVAYGKVGGGGGSGR
jgi:hypothetical protein